MQTSVLGEVLVKILNAAMLAPSGGNIQQWHFIILKDDVISGLELLRVIVWKVPSRIASSDCRLRRQEGLSTLVRRTHRHQMLDFTFGYNHFARF